MLRWAPLDQGANAASYRGPTLPLAAGLVERIADFLTADRLVLQDDGET